MACVNHNRTVTHLYVSEVQGLKFSLSLERVVYFNPKGANNDTWLRFDTHRFEIRTFIHSFVRSFVRSFIHSFIHSVIHSVIHSFTHSFTHSFIHSFTHSFIHSLIHSFTHSLTHSFIHSFILNSSSFEVRDKKKVKSPFYVKKERDV